ncbi:MAG: DUF4157 domain-containing protein [Salinibacter sp.]|uniref:eCIS core domain-containing protein n=1 Tax=Salinibacter sp. TaxID=2065818 RepID=UPI002FC375EB
MSEPGDKYEREAERVADAVMRMEEPQVDIRDAGRSDKIQRMCPRCQRRYRQGKPLNCEECEAELRRKESSGERPTVSGKLQQQIRSLQGGGRPLPTSVQAFFESRFRQSFSGVRIHTGARADDAAQRLGARAFAVGQDVAFRSGAYRPGSTNGKRLLAHELTHVLQQRSGDRPQVKVHRHTDDEPEEVGSGQDSDQDRQDIALLLSPGADEAAKALTVSPDAEQLRVTSPDDMAEKLNEVSDPIGRLLIFSHSLDSGDLGFETGSGTTYVRPEDLANALDGAVPPARGPTVVDFRGCSLGTSPSGMEQIRAALHAKSAIGGNCFMVHQVNGPVVLSSGEGNDTPITRREQLGEADREPFEEGLEMLREAFGPARSCILDDSEDAYFRAGGRFVAMWANPGMSTEWDERKSKCYQELSTRTVDPATAGKQDPGLAGNCELIRIEEPSEGPEQPSNGQDSAATPTDAPGAERARWSISGAVGAELLPELRALAGMGAEVSLRPDSIVVFNPLIGLNLLYVPGTKVTSEDLFAASVDVALRVQKPVEGAYLDVSGGGFVGFDAESKRRPGFVGGLGAALGAGYRWQRLEVGAEVGGRFPLTESDPNRLLVLGRVGLRF